MYAGQVGAGVFRGGGESHTLDHFFEVLNIQRDGRFVIRCGHGRELIRADAFNVGVERTAFDIQRLGAFVHRQDHIFVGEVRHEVRERARRHGQPTVLADLCSEPSADAKLEVGGRETQATFVGLDQDV